MPLRQRNRFIDSGRLIRDKLLHILRRRANHRDVGRQAGGRRLALAPLPARDLLRLDIGGADGFFSATITIGRDADGKRIRKRIRSKTFSGLREKRQEFERQRAQGLVVHGTKPTLKAFLHDWLEQVVKPRNRPRTYDRYEMDIRNHILPHLSRIRLDQLTPQEAQKVINDLHASGLAPRSVRNVHATLRQALNTALRWGLVGRNVAALVDTPKAEKPQIHALSPDEARRLLNAVR